MKPFGATHRVVCYDSRGHGASSASAPPYTMSTLGHDVLAIVDELGIDRFSYMTPDQRGETLQISLSRGIAASIAEKVHVRIGQGIAGWVAHNRKPLLVRAVGESGVPHTHQDNYNSDSFLCVPVVHNDVLFGVLNLSNKRDGSLFGQADLDRAMLLSQFIAMSQERLMIGKRAQAWAS